MSKMIDETGKRYGMLTVIGRGPNDKNGKAQWYCKCDCGNTILSRGTDLRRNKVLTCGCTSYEKGSQLIGQKFGKLTVLEFLGNNSYGKHIYKCRCECGNTVIVNGNNLKSKNTQSCGCIKKEKSIGEQNIEKILESENIRYKTQVKFPDLKYISYLYYDFALLDDNNNIIRLIEFDGIQHFKELSKWYDEEVSIRDELKNKYARQNNIPLIRIPYTERDSMSLDDLLSDKWLVSEMREM